MFVPNAAVAKAAIKQTLFGQELVNTLYFSNGTAGWSEADLNTLCNRLWTWVTTEVAPIMSNNLQYNSVEAYSLASTSAPVGFFVPAAPVAGSSMTAAPPGNVAFVITFYTAARGRTSRGRNYLSGIPESQITGNQATATVAANIRNAYDALRTNATYRVGDWVVYSRTENLQPRSVGVERPITFVDYVDLNMDSQRRRLTGRGI